MAQDCWQSNSSDQSSTSRWTSLTWGTHLLATITSSGFGFPVLVDHFGSVRPDKLFAQLGDGGLVCHVFGDKSPIQPKRLGIPIIIRFDKIGHKTVCFRAEYRSEVSLEERKLIAECKTVMGQTDVLFILTPVEGQVPGFLTLNVLVTEISLGLPAFATVWR